MVPAAVLPLALLPQGEPWGSYGVSVKRAAHDREDAPDAVPLELVRVHCGIEVAHPEVGDRFIYMLLYMFYHSNPHNKGAV